MIVGLYVETGADLKAMIGFPEGLATVSDVPKCATGGATLLFNDETVLVPFALHCER
jgi:hypothetical protein